jgi:acyl-CoA synthetase (AMP-forming)/AMP-acid ligase II
MKDTVLGLLREGDDSCLALLGTDGTELSYEAVRRQLDGLRSELASLGVGTRDRVAIIVPNGPLAALAFLAGSTGAAAAPLNPKYRESEFEFYLTDLAPRLVLVSDDTSPAALAAAETVGATTATISGPPGALTLGGDPGAVVGAQPTPDEAGLFLHTSGTTSRPKVVRISQRNLTRSARNIAASLALTPSDRGLNVMPLFHIHGLLAGLLAPISAGAAVVATPGFDAFTFFKLLEQFAPTYYTAVPTMHQMIIDRAKRRPGAAAEAGLRFIRSSSASLPAPVLEELETLFEAPVIEAYGMTEATHQMCANPLPPGQRKIRSVGQATGIDLAVLDEGGAPVDADEIGQVAIKGATVVTAYHDNPDATRDAFHEDWFLTGDQGYLDSDGYLFLTGRLKELINRGGEKISPLEVDEALLRHEAVAQAVTFGVAHGKLGEDVAAGVVLEPDIETSERELRDFVSESLAAFKVPRTILFLDELPKGATGKLQRIGLAERLDVGPW